MQTLNFPFCCTGKILADFGGTQISGGDKGDDQTVESMVAYMEKQMAMQSNLAFFSAVTNSDQTVANKALSRLGFSCSNWMAKKNHPNTKVRLWWKALEEKATRKPGPPHSL